MIEVSIIVPVYNVEKYLAKCLCSLIDQSSITCEIIIIDDGSSDSSYYIAKEYESLYPFIKLIRKSNGGQSSARNLGLKQAAGNYILFVDSDDFIGADTLKMLYDKAIGNKLDILHGDCRYCDEDGIEIAVLNKKPVLPHQNCVMDGKLFLKESLKNGCYDIVIWLNLIRRQYIYENDLWFHEGVYYEDQEYTLKLFTANNNRVMRVDIPFYFYRIRESSTTHLHNIKKIYDFYEVINDMIIYVEKSGFDRETYSYCYMTISIAYYHMTQVYIKLSSNERTQLNLIDNKHIKRAAKKFPCHNKRIWLQNKLFMISPRCLVVIYSVTSSLKSFIKK